VSIILGGSSPDIQYEAAILPDTRKIPFKYWAILTALNLLVIYYPARPICSKNGQLFTGAKGVVLDSSGYKNPNATAKQVIKT